MGKDAAFEKLVQWIRGMELSGREIEELESIEAEYSNGHCCKESEAANKRRSAQSQRMLEVWSKRNS